LMLVSAPLLRPRVSFYPTVILFVATGIVWRATVLQLVGPDDTLGRFIMSTQMPGTLDEFAVGILIARWAAWRRVSGVSQAEPTSAGSATASTCGTCPSSSP